MQWINGTLWWVILPREIVKISKKKKWGYNNFVKKKYRYIPKFPLVPFYLNLIIKSNCKCEN